MVSKNNSFEATVITKKRVSYAPGLASGSFLVITPASKEPFFETTSAV